MRHICNDPAACVFRFRSVIYFKYENLLKNVHTWFVPGLYDH